MAFLKVNYFFALAAFALQVAVHADENAFDPHRIVGRVYSTMVTADDIGLNAPIDQSIKFDSRDKDLWMQMTRISQAFGKPIQDRFVKDQKIDVTAEELDRMQMSMQKRKERDIQASAVKIAELEKQIAAGDLADEERAKLRDRQSAEKSRRRRLVQSNSSKLPAELGRSFIHAWKVEKELHRKYGGRVIFQQFGPEAVDARRRLFEDAEKAGDLQFHDDGVRHLFYYYSNMQHSVIDEKSLEQPWFFEDAK